MTLAMQLERMPVKPPVGIREVAAHAGVSVATVSNVLNRPEIVAEATRKRVLVSIEALGFVRNESARQLRAGRSRMIGLVVLDVANPFFTDVARGVEDEASKSGLSVILCNSDDQRREGNPLPRTAGRTPCSGHPDHAGHRAPTSASPGCSDGGPRSSLSIAGRPPRGQCSVSVDDVLGGDLAMSLPDRGGP